MLQDRLRLVLFDRLWHHVQDIVHNRRSQFQIVMRFYSLFSHCLRNTLAIPSLELSSKQITKPKKLNSPLAL